MVGAIRSEHGLENAFTIYDQNVNLRLCNLTEIFIEYKVPCSKKNSRNREIIKETEEFVALMR